MSITSSLQQRWTQRRVRPPSRGPAARLAMPTPAGTAQLRFTEWLFFAVLALAYMFALSTPIFGTKLFITGISHLPLALLGPVLALHLVGRALNGGEPQMSPALAVTWPLIVLGLFALVGSSLAKWEFGVDDTYLAFAVYTLVLPLYVAAVPVEIPRARRWAVAMLALMSAFSGVALLGEAARFQSSEALHEIEYLVTCGFFFIYLVSRSWGMKALALVLLIAAAVLNRKLTGYIIALLALAHIVLAAGWRNVLPRSRPLLGVLIAVLVTVSVIGLGLLFIEFRSYLPSGNADVRLRQYEAAWTSFLASPLYGQAFLSGSGEDFVEHVRRMNIPTHSDVLDILKHGGLIALSLFLVGYWKLFRLINGAIASTHADHVLHAYFIGMRFFQITAFFTFLINPLLLKGPFLVVIWANLGIAAGVALRLRNDGAAISKPTVSVRRAAA